MTGNSGGTILYLRNSELPVRYRINVASRCLEPEGHRNTVSLESHLGQNKRMQSQCCVRHIPHRTSNCDDCGVSGWLPFHVRFPIMFLTNREEFSFVLSHEQELVVIGVTFSFNLVRFQMPRWSGDDVLRPTLPLYNFLLSERIPYCFKFLHHIAHNFSF